MNILLFYFIFVLSVASTALVIWWYHRYGWLDDPKKNKHPKVVHTQPVPRGGGLAVFFPLLIGIMLFLPHTKQVLGIVIGMTVLAILGFWDDLRDPPPIVRLIIQFLAAGCAIAAGIGIAFVTNPFSSGVIWLNQPQLLFSLFGSTHTVWILADIVGFVWLVWCMNIVNFSKGLDGQMPGYVMIASIVIGLLSLRFPVDPTQQIVFRMTLIIAATYAGFLVWNVFPQRIMSGFGASTIAGFLLGVLSIMSGAKLATAILVLAVPMLDAAFVIVNRLRNKQSPFMGDRSHLHHMLMEIGWGKRRIAFFYWATAALLGFIALQLKSEQKAFTIATITIVMLGVLIWLRFFTTHFGKSGQDNG